MFNYILAKTLYMPKIDEELLSFDKNGFINNLLHKSYSKSLYTFSDSMRLLWHLLLLFFIYRAFLTDRELSEMLRNIFYKIMCYIIELLYSEKTYEEFSLVYHQLLNDIDIDLSKEKLSFHQTESNRMFGPVTITITYILNCTIIENYYKNMSF